LNCQYENNQNSITTTLGLNSKDYEMPQGESPSTSSRDLQHYQEHNQEPHGLGDFKTKQTNNLL
jgi:hypothetical protein